MSEKLNIFKESKDLYFEPLESKHLSAKYISWLNDEETTKFNSHGIYPNSYEKTKEYIQSIQFDKTIIVFAMIEKSTNSHIGNASIQQIDLINSNADIAIVIGEKSVWGKGYATQAFSVMIEHSFNNLNLHKVTAGTTSDNIGMQKVLEKLDFEKEGIFKESIQRNGKFLDIYEYGLINKR